MDVRYYRTAAGNSPVEDYVECLDAQTQAKILAMLMTIEKHGLSGAGVVARHIAGKVWELKPGNQRLFYVVIDGPTLVIVHAYKKQSQKAPKQEIETAKSRANEILKSAKEES